MRVYVTASLAPPITRVLGARQRLPGVFFAFGNDQSLKRCFFAAVGRIVAQ